MKDPFIVGEKVYLRGVEREDLPKIAKWTNDPEVTLYLFMGARPTSLEAVTEEWEKRMKATNEIEFAICDKKTNSIIGWCGLYSINWISHSGEYRIFIGEKSYWSKGIGTEVAKLVVQYGFEKLNLNKVWLGVNSSHEGAVRSYEKGGFVREGILRKEIYRNNRYYDAVRMSVLREEYENKK